MMVRKKTVGLNTDCTEVCRNYLHRLGDEKKADFLRRLYRTVYLRDIYERNNIELRPEFEELSKTVASSIGAPVNALNIAKRSSP